MQNKCSCICRGSHVHPSLSTHPVSLVPHNCTSLASPNTHLHQQLLALDHPDRRSGVGRHQCPRLGHHVLGAQILGGGGDEVSSQVGGSSQSPNQPPEGREEGRGVAVMGGGAQSGWCPPEPRSPAWSMKGEMEGGGVMGGVARGRRRQPGPKGMGGVWELDMGQADSSNMKQRSGLIPGGTSPVSVGTLITMSLTTMSMRASPSGVPHLSAVLGQTRRTPLDPPSEVGSFFLYLHMGRDSRSSALGLDNPC